MLLGAVSSLSGVKGREVGTWNERCGTFQPSVGKSWGWRKRERQDLKKVGFFEGGGESTCLCMFRQMQEERRLS